MQLQLGDPHTCAAAWGHALLPMPALTHQCTISFALRQARRRAGNRVAWLGPTLAVDFTSHTHTQIYCNAHSPPSVRLCWQLCRSSKPRTHCQRRCSRWSGWRVIGSCCTPQSPLRCAFACVFADGCRGAWQTQRGLAGDWRLLYTTITITVRFRMCVCCWVQGRVADAAGAGGGWRLLYTTTTSGALL